MKLFYCYLIGKNFPVPLIYKHLHTNQYQQETHQILFIIIITPDLKLTQSYLNPRKVELRWSIYFGLEDRESRRFSLHVNRILATKCEIQSFIQSSEIRETDNTTVNHTPLNYYQNSTEFNIVAKLIINLNAMTVSSYIST